MSGSFTPGPWACQSTDCDGPDYGVSIIGLRLNDDGRPMETPTNGIVAAALPWPTEIDSGDMSRVEANARLIAAAPELLEALENLLASCGWRGEYHALKYWDAATAAEALLAKARLQHAHTANAPHSCAEKALEKGVSQHDHAR